MESCGVCDYDLWSVTDKDGDTHSFNLECICTDCGQPIKLCMGCAFENTKGISYTCKVCIRDKELEKITNDLQSDYLSKEELKLLVDTLQNQMDEQEINDRNESIDDLLE